MPVTTRIWDIFLHDGWKIIYTVGLALLKLLSTELLATDFTGVMSILGQDMKSSFFDANRIIKTAKVTSKSHTRPSI